MDRLIQQKLDKHEKNGGQRISPDDPDFKAAMEFTARVLAGERPEMVDILTKQVKKIGAPVSGEPMAKYKQRGGYDKSRKPENNWGKWQVCNGDPAAHKVHSLAHIPAPPMNVEIPWVERDDPNYPPDRLLPGEPDDVGSGSEDGEHIPWVPSSFCNLPKSNIPDRVLTMLTREQQLSRQIDEDDDSVFYPPGGKHPPRSPPKPVEPFIKRPYHTTDKPAAAPTNTTTPVAVTTITAAEIQALGSSSHIRAQSSGSGIQFTPTPSQPRAMALNESVQNNTSLASSPFGMNSASQLPNPQQAGKHTVIRAASNLRPEVPAFSLAQVAGVSSDVAPPSDVNPLLSGVRGSGAVEPTMLATTTALEARLEPSKTIADPGFESVVDKAKVDRDEYLARNNLYIGGSLNHNNLNYGYHTRTPGGAAAAGMGPGRVGGTHVGGMSMVGGSMGGSSGSVFNIDFGAASLGGNNVGMGKLSGLLADHYHQDLHAPPKHNPLNEHPAPGSYVHLPQAPPPRHIANNGLPYGGHVANHSFDNNAYKSQYMDRPAAFASNIRRPASVADQRAVQGSFVETTHGHGTMDFGSGQTQQFSFPGGQFNNQDQDEQ